MHTEHSQHTRHAEHRAPEHRPQSTQSTVSQSAPSTDQSTQSTQSAQSTEHTEHREHREHRAQSTEHRAQRAPSTPNTEQVGEPVTFEVTCFVVVSSRDGRDTTCFTLCLTRAHDTCSGRDGQPATHSVATTCDSTIATTSPVHSQPPTVVGAVEVVYLQHQSAQVPVLSSSTNVAGRQSRSGRSSSDRLGASAGERRGRGHVTKSLPAER
jgi:hypothetical protein